MSSAEHTRIRELLGQVDNLHARLEPMALEHPTGPVADGVVAVLSRLHQTALTVLGDQALAGVPSLEAMWDCADGSPFDLGAILQKRTMAHESAIAWLASLRGVIVSRMPAQERPPGMGLRPG